MAKREIQLGQDIQPVFTIKDAAGLAVDLTLVAGLVIYLYHPSGGKTLAKYSLNSVEGHLDISEVSLVDGQVMINIEASQTRDLQLEGKDLWAEVRVMYTDAAFENGTRDHSSAHYLLTWAGSVTRNLTSQ